MDKELVTLLPPIVLKSPIARSRAYIKLHFISPLRLLFASRVPMGQLLLSMKNYFFNSDIKVKNMYLVFISFSEHQKIIANPFRVYHFVQG